VGRRLKSLVFWTDPRWSEAGKHSNLSSSRHEKETEYIMGACSSSEGESSPSEADWAAAGDNPIEMAQSAQMDKQLRFDHNESRDTVKTLLLGAGESGKSTIFKQGRILYGTPRNDEELRMYGVIVRANIIVAVRKILFLIKHLRLEEMLDDEGPKAEGDMCPRLAFDEVNEILSGGVGSNLLAKDTSLRVMNGTGEASNNRAGTEEAAAENDWVGQSARAGLMANDDAKLFLKHWKAINALWQVSDGVRCRLPLGSTSIA
jgi:hypothetical protein